MAARLGAGGEGSATACLQDGIAMGGEARAGCQRARASGRDPLRVLGNYSRCDAWKRKRDALVA